MPCGPDAQRRFAPGRPTKRPARCHAYARVGMFLLMRWKHGYASVAMAPGPRLRLLRRCAPRNDMNEPHYVIASEAKQSQPPGWKTASLRPQQYPVTPRPATAEETPYGVPTNKWCNRQMTDPRSIHGTPPPSRGWFRCRAARRPACVRALCDSRWESP